MSNNTFLPYGPAFKLLREKRGFTQKQAAGTIISTQFLRRFEKGVSDISLANFGRLLVSIGATWDDFFRYYKGESIFRELSLAEEIGTKIHSGHLYDGLKIVDSAFSGDYSDNPELRPTYRLAFRSFFHSLGLTPKLTETELARIFNYINAIDTWGIFEYSLFSYIIFDCPYEMVRYRANRLFDAISKSNFSFLQTKKEDVNVLIYAISYFSKNGYYDDATQMIKKLEKELNKPYFLRMFTEKYSLKLHEAMNLLRQDDPEGLKIARNCIRFLEAYEALDNSTISAIEKNKIFSTVSALNKTGIPFDVD
ncbi:helix-turn-helix domain-containing protein [Streptococcus merionis]|uniref:helix-turn-helix domain-containing protein n=1 Tax=Streptococcus merionis TaxID=400065 RepID=UPI003510D7D0